MAVVSVSNSTIDGRGRSRSVVSALPFSPLTFGPLGWWDAADAATFTFSSGTSVSQWNDKSGNGYDFVQSVAANQPSRSGTVNGISTVVFDNTNDSLSVANFNMTGGQQWTVGIVFTAASGGDRIIVEHSTNYNLNAGAWAIFRTSSNIVSWGKFGGIGYSIFDSTATVTTTPAIAIGTHNGTLTTNETSGWINGDGSGTRPINNNTNANNLNATLFVGSRAGTTAFLNGQICELVIYPKVLTNSERRQLETYLSTKWAVTF